MSKNILHRAVTLVQESMHAAISMDKTEMMDTTLNNFTEVFNSSSVGIIVWNFFFLCYCSNQGSKYLGYLSSYFRRCNLIDH